MKLFCMRVKLFTELFWNKPNFEFEIRFFENKYYVKSNIHFIVLLYIFVSIFNIFNSSTDTEISVENAEYELQNQITRIEGALGVIVLVFVFLFNIKLDESHRLIAYKLLTIIISMLILSIIALDPKNETRNIRNIRIYTEKLYNQSVILFILCLLVIYFGITKI